MLKAEWGDMTYPEQVGYLSKIMHVVASKMEMGCGANSEGEVMGATAGILSSIPNPSISRFYEDRGELLRNQVRKAMVKLREYGQVSKEDSGEILSVYPGLPDIEKLVSAALNVQSQNLKDSYRHLYDDRGKRGGGISEGAAPPYSGSARFHR